MKAKVRRALQQGEIRARRKRQEIARNGGKARAQKLTPERRQEIARLGGTARSEMTRSTAEPYDELKRKVAAWVLIERRDYSAADIERQFGWDRQDVERWIEAGKRLW